MHRSLAAIGALSLSLAAIAAPSSAGAQARVAEQKVVGPPAPEAVLAGEPAAPVAATNNGNKKLSPLESAMHAAAKDLVVTSRRGMLVNPESGARIPQGASEAVISVMSKQPTGEADAQLRNALMMSGNDGGDVDHLMSELPELVSEPNPGHTRSARKAYDEFMAHASESFRTNPPAEMMAINAALSRMGSAEAGYREDERARKEDEKARKSKPRNAKKAAAEEKKRAAAEKKAAEKRAAEEKKAAEKRAAEEKKAAEKRAAEEKKAAEKAAKEKKGSK